jgi:squalene synthase HpnC
MSSELDSAYKEALLLAKTHYENFPVVSLFVKKNLRKHVAVIYWFARTADDIADEGEFTPDERIIRLNEFLQRFENTLNGVCFEKVDLALHNTIVSFNLDIQLFRDLISAFKQDIFTSRYHTFFDILDYCKRSANPIGRLILQLNSIEGGKLKGYSDKICTSLQLINFYQDISIDFKRNRLYIPIEEIISYGINEEMLVKGSYFAKFPELLRFQIRRAVSIMEEGFPLIDNLKGRLKVQISATYFGGLVIAQKISNNGYNSHLLRPKLSKLDYFNLFIKSIFYVVRTSKSNIKEKQ